MNINCPFCKDNLKEHEIIKYKDGGTSECGKCEGIFHYCRKTKKYVTGSVIICGCNYDNIVCGYKKENKLSCLDCKNTFFRQLNKKYCPKCKSFNVK